MRMAFKCFFFQEGIWGELDKIGMDETMYWEKVPIPHSGYSLRVGVVPSLQRSQPGSEQPNLTAERRMQQNKT